MSGSKADLLLHPIRMRIVQALVNGRRRTTRQLLEEMKDIPQATMYRQLNKLVASGVILAEEGNKARGTIEKIYFLSPGGEDATPLDTTEQAAGEHMALFQSFLSSLAGDFGAYLRQKSYDLKRDGFSMRQVQLFLTDEEYMDLLTEMRGVMSRYEGNPAGGTRRRRMISTIVIPGAEQAGGQDKEEQ